MFEGLTSNLKTALSGLARGGKLTEGNIRDGLREVRQALLEADVNYEIATSFIERVTEQSVGEKVLKSIRPDEQIVGIVHQELINLMGPVEPGFAYRPSGITVIMMCGLQGSGKTTTCGKLARLLKEQGRKPMLVAADLQRPAAIEQLKVIAGQVDVPVHAEAPDGNNAVKVCQNGLNQAKKLGNVDTVILDTAGRLHVDADLMKELEQIEHKLQPDQVIFACDAMTGQDAVNSAKAFNDALELDGVILTKLDGDTRGGAALSVKEVTGVPIKFIGVGEALDRLEQFHPDRMAGRILGMGDVVSLVEKAQEQFNEEEAADLQNRMASGKFSLNDFQKQMATIRKMGPMREIMKMIPGMGGLMDTNPDVDPGSEMKRIDAIISSMTPAEREDPGLIDHSRRRRIALGSGSDPSDISRLVKDFNNMAGMMQKMAGMGMRDKMKAMRELSSGAMMDPMGGMNKKKERSKRGGDPLKLREKKKKDRKNKKKQRKKNR
ncbi:signal recognition particle protein [Gimesia maris]|uniref:signal recognition particle protein n=1 Tax=Gimesia maris TaxID=122 RepID=UPI00242002BF|nr:signal recognition particle protein [Gimesia maris]